METIQQMIDKVRHRERDELRSAVMNHGNEFIDGWEVIFDVDEERPIVTAYINDEPCDVVILSVRVDKSGKITITGEDKLNRGEEHEIYTGDIFVGQVQYITSNI